jgi:hypothetical protein
VRMVIDMAEMVFGMAGNLCIKCADQCPSLLKTKQILTWGVSLDYSIQSDRYISFPFPCPVGPPAQDLFHQAPRSVPFESPVPSHCCQFVQCKSMPRHIA